MADQKRWFKLWHSALSDDNLMTLPPALRWAWAALGAHTKVHGTNGVVVVNPRNPVLAAALGVDPGEVIATLVQLPNIYIGTAPVRSPHGKRRNPVCDDGEYIRGNVTNGSRGVTLVNCRGRNGVLQTEFPILDLASNSKESELPPGDSGVETGWVLVNCRGRDVVEEWCRRNGTITVTWRNWSKYQEDTTAAARGAALRSKRRREESIRSVSDLRTLEDQSTQILVSSAAGKPSANGAETVRQGQGPDKQARQQELIQAEVKRWSPPVQLPWFCKWWATLPAGSRVEGKECERIWRKKKLEPSGEAITAALADQLTWPKYQGDQVRYLKKGPSWLEKRRWEDPRPAQPAPIQVNETRWQDVVPNK